MLCCVPQWQSCHDTKWSRVWYLLSKDIANICCNKRTPTWAVATDRRLEPTVYSGWSLHIVHHNDRPITCWRPNVVPAAITSNWLSVVRHISTDLLQQLSQVQFWPRQWNLHSIINQHITLQSFVCNIHYVLCKVIFTASLLTVSYLCTTPPQPTDITRGLYIHVYQVSFNVSNESDTKLDKKFKLNESLQNLHFHLNNNNYQYEIQRVIGCTVLWLMTAASNS